ncbi:MAG: L-lactate permease [Actinomycetota bacterium]|nr:L-lactate permease [Actinomycetota bacterium]
MLTETYQQVLDPVGGSFALSSVFAVLPLLTLFVLLGGLKLKAWLAGLISLAVAVVVAIAVYGMPVGQTLLSASEGAAFGFFPILWVVINAIWVYNLTVATGHFDVLRRSFEKVSPDQRIQAVIIAFCFGGLLEALAGFGTPVAISVVMLMALGFQPMKAAVLALLANTAPVAFGALATPIVTLAAVTSGVQPENPGLTVDNLGAMVGRQTPLLALFVPLLLVYVVDGKRGLRQTWLPAVVCGVAFSIGQFVSANYISVPLADIIASLAGAAAVVALLRVWQPSEMPVVAEPRGGGAAAPGTEGAPGGADLTTVDAARGTSGPHSPARDGAVQTRPVVDTPAEVAKAYLPYIIIIVIFSVANLPAVKEALAVPPWTYKFPWPGLDVLTTAGQPQASATFTFGWLPAAGTLMIIAGLLTMALLKVSPAKGLRVYGETYYELRYAIVTVMAVLALAYVMNQSGQTGTLGNFLAGTGALFALLSPILGWIGVAVTGSDTSANALFGALQVQTAVKAGLDPVLLAAANTSGGVLGKMVSPQNLAIAASAVGLAGQEGVILRKVLGYSLAMLVFMCALVALQATPVLDWMVTSQ